MPKHGQLETFGAAELGDPRRTDRLVKVASALGENPSGLLACEHAQLADIHAAYQFWASSHQP